MCKTAKKVKNKCIKLFSVLKIIKLCAIMVIEKLEDNYMNKEMNWLVLIPAWGTVILYFWLFLKMRKGYIDGKKLKLYFFLSGLVGIVSTLLCVISIVFLSSLIDMTNLLSATGPIFLQLITTIVAGYIVNIFTFILINVKWYEL